MGYVLPPGSSKKHSSYERTGPSKRRRTPREISVKLPEPVRIPPPSQSERSPKP
jgi:hypothetical protein